MREDVLLSALGGGGEGKQTCSQGCSPGGAVVCETRLRTARGELGADGLLFLPFTDYSGFLCPCPSHLLLPWLKSADKKPSKWNTQLFQCLSKLNFPVSKHLLNKVGDFLIKTTSLNILQNQSFFFQRLLPSYPVLNTQRTPFLALYSGYTVNVPQWFTKWFPS